MSPLVKVVGAFVRVGGKLTPHGETVELSDERAARLASDGIVEPVAGQAAEPIELGDDATDDQLGEANVEPLEAWVGADKDRARRVLDLEQAKGKKARKTLVAALEAIAKAGDA